MAVLLAISVLTAVWLLPVQGLASREKLASLTVAQLSKYLQLHHLPTGGKKAEVVARVLHHVQQQQA